MLAALIQKPSFRALRAFALVLALCVLILPHNARAGRRPKQHEPQGSAYHVIRSVDENAKTVTVGTENSKDVTQRVVKVTAFTVITVDGQKATMHDLQTGMKVELDLESDNEAKELEASHVDKK